MRPIFTDQAKSGATAAASRVGFSEAMELLGEGDLLVVLKLDRVGRAIADLIHLLKLFGDRSTLQRALGRDTEVIIQSKHVSRCNLTHCFSKETGGKRKFAAVLLDIAR